MRKIIIAFIAGALLMATGQAFADDLSLIGKKIQGEAELYLDGKQMSDVIIVDGKSYAPVRELAEGVGRSVYFKEATEDNKAIISLSAALFQQEQRIKTLQDKIEQNKKEIQTITENAKILLQKLTDEANSKGIGIESYQKILSDDQAMRSERIAELEEELKGMEIELEALESTN